jgi:Zinc carboxypeptidase
MTRHGWRWRRRGGVSLLRGHTLRRTVASLTGAAALTLCLGLAATATARPDGSPHGRPGGVGTIAGTFAPYRGYTPYARIAATLRSLAQRSSGRLTVSFSGDSAGGRPLWVVTATAPMSRKVAADNARFRRLLLNDPDAARAMLTAGSDVRVPVFINCSIHGDEPTGTDAGLALLRRLALRRDALTKAILRHAIVVVDPVQNPDGRVADSRLNGNGFDCNRDFITLTQPEDVITTNTIKTWLPATMLDLHGFTDPMLIEPTTIPHNPNLEYDLLIKSALPLSRAMGRAVHAQLGIDYQIPYLWGTGEDTLGNANEGWDDYGPYYTPSLAQEYGCVGLTAETPSNTTLGVAADVAAGMACFHYSIDHRLDLLRNQADYFRRGADDASAVTTGRPWQGDMTDMVRAAVWNGSASVVKGIAWGRPGFPYGNLVGNLTFPYAYVVPVDPNLQADPLEAYKFIDHCLEYGLRVDAARSAFVSGSTTYPAGTFVIRLAQPLRGLANNLLWDGEDVKATYGVSSMYDIAAWSLPYQWGFSREVAATPFTAELTRIRSAAVRPVRGAPTAADFCPRVVGRAGRVMGAGPVFWWKGDDIWAFLTANQMLARRYSIGMVTRQMVADPAVPSGAFLIDTRSRSGAAAFVAAVANRYGIDFTTTAATVTEASHLRTPSVRVAADPDTFWVLTQQMGFSVVSNWNASAAAVPAATTAVVGASANGPSLAVVQRWLQGFGGAAARTYVGFDRGADQSFATGLLGPGVTSAQDPAVADNGVVALDFARGDVLTAFSPARGYAFAYPPRWFTVTGLGVTADAVYRQATAGPFQEGFWNNADQAAVGSAALISGSFGTATTSRVVLLGFHPTFRGFQDATAPILARAVLLSAAQPPAAP